MRWGQEPDRFTSLLAATTRSPLRQFLWRLLLAVLTLMVAVVFVIVVYVFVL